MSGEIGNPAVRKLETLKKKALLSSWFDAKMLSSVIGNNMEEKMEKIYTVHLEQSEIELLLAMCRRSLWRTDDMDRKRKLGSICDNLDGTLMADMLQKAFRNLEDLQASLDEHKKAEKRKHLRVVV